MDLHAQQQFDFLLMTAIERFTERLVQRNGGAVPALERLRAEGASGEVRVFVDALFVDFLLDNPAGACFVLEALSTRTVAAGENGTIGPTGTLGALLMALAKRHFGDLLGLKAEEALEQAAAFE